ncbi:protein slowmo, putative [Pediculus humanus corporis]|uniref:Protein slowmo, putative n=1 Tax=Pediculus humanus subsp. corporis TaxID=121224 RepID=E0VVK9_PEDHC|nr:protein slowmo, putative [Pediculus humanus corporis]EEB17415.1 protein slowmo, putative [Pediculus humanus corporis]
MKIWTSEYTFNHPWETVAQAAWRKYPNPMNTAVIGTDVVERKVVDGILHTHRLVSSKWLFPSWAQPFVGSTNVCYASELSQVDPKNKEMILKTRNLSLCNYIAVDETVRYIPHPSDPEKTLLKQEAVVTVQGMPLTNYVEDVMTNRISLNAGKGRQAIEWVISKIEAEVQELKNSAVKSTDEIIHQTKKSIDDFTNSAKKSMDELSSAAKKSFDSFTSPPNQKLPKF